MALEKKDIKRPVLPKEAIFVPEFNGEIIVRALLLRDRFDIAVNDSRPRFAQICELLARAVVDANGEPVFNVDEWEVWGALNQDSMMMLWDKAKQLNGMSGEKKEQTQT